MAKILKKKARYNEINYEQYMLGDSLFDLLRGYYNNNGGLDSEEWKLICKRDIEQQKTRKKKRINDKRNYNL